jgi:hypothetical protein
MRLNSFVYGIFAISIFLGTVLVAQASGYWSVSGKMSGTGEKIEATGANVDEIKGWMTIGDVAQAYNVPLDEILAAFELPADTPPSVQLKSLESDTFSVGNLRAWLGERMEQ